MFGNRNIDQLWNEPSVECPETCTPAHKLSATLTWPHSPMDLVYPIVQRDDFRFNLPRFYQMLVLPWDWNQGTTKRCAFVSRMQIKSQPKAKRPDLGRGYHQHACGPARAGHDGDSSRGGPRWENCITVHRCPPAPHTSGRPSASSLNTKACWQVLMETGLESHSGGGSPGMSNTSEITRGSGILLWIRAAMEIEALWRQGSSFKLTWNCTP